MSASVNTRPQSHVAAVQHELERLIATGALQGGHRINESALAIRLGVSRGPIREACRTLEQTGLLKSEPNRGFFVREISLKEALDIYDLRAELSGMAGRLAAASITRGQLAELERLVDGMERAAERDDVGAYYPLNVEFHTHLIACANNHKLTQLWPALESALHLFRTKSFLMPGSLRSSNYDHRAAVAALREGDAAQAGRVMHDHILKGKARLLRTLD